MKIRELKLIGIEKLNSKKIDDSNFKTEKLLEYLLKMNKAELIINSENEIDEKIKNNFLILIEELIKGKPLQYITKVQEFMGFKFYVDENVLIPQPDTEILVEKAIEIINRKKQKEITILDLCTGSGAIGISIKKYNPLVEVYASDISEKALEIAKKNAKLNNVSINFIRSDMFNNIEDLKFDIIISNPPYIETSEIEKLPIDVKSEPHIALDGGDDGLKYYTIIKNKGYKYLKNGGHILLEIGYNQYEKVPELFRKDKNYKNIEIHKDLSNIFRVVKIEKS